jgi:hypothetical protein
MGSWRALRHEVLTAMKGTYIWFGHVGSLCRSQRVWCKSVAPRRTKRLLRRIAGRRSWAISPQLSIELCWAFASGSGWRSSKKECEEEKSERCVKRAENEEVEGRSDECSEYR